MNSVASTKSVAERCGFVEANYLTVLTPITKTHGKHDMQVLLCIMVAGGLYKLRDQKPEQPDEKATYKGKKGYKRQRQTRLREAGHGKLDDPVHRISINKVASSGIPSTVQQIYRWKEEDFRVVKIEADLILEANRYSVDRNKIWRKWRMLSYLSYGFTEEIEDVTWCYGCKAHGDPNGKNDQRK
ncbi:hypothetical protein TNCV_2273501 [Trichonephila clavipes]|nr:hypothetical protein TNCV_2273501 [Trichonephila clavipes]